MAMRIALSADHAGFELKDLLAAWLACMTLAWALERRALRATPTPDQGPPS